MNDYDTLYYNGTSGRCRHESRYGGTLPWIQQSLAIVLQWRTRPDCAFSHAALYPNPPARSAKAPAWRGRIATQYAKLFLRHSCWIYQYGAGTARPLRKPSRITCHAHALDWYARRIGRVDLRLAGDALHRRLQNADQRAIRVIRRIVRTGRQSS